MSPLLDKFFHHQSAERQLLLPGAAQAADAVRVISTDGLGRGFPSRPCVWFDAEEYPLMAWQRHWSVNESGLIEVGSARDHELSQATSLVVGTSSARITEDSFSVGHDAHGHAVASWAIKTGAGSDVHAARYDKKGRFDAAWTLARGTEGVYLPVCHVAFDAAGAAVIAWTAKVGGSYRLDLAHCALRGPMGPSRTIAHDVDGSPSLAFLDRHVLVVWTRKTEGRWLVEAAQFDPADESAPTVVALSEVAGYVSSISLRVDDHGNAVVVYRRWVDQEGPHVEVATRVAGRDWTVARQVSAPGVGVGGIGGIAAAFDHAGNAVIAWGRSAAGMAAVEAVVWSSQSNDFSGDGTVSTSGSAKRLHVWPEPQGVGLLWSALAPGGARRVEGTSWSSLTSSFAERQCLVELGPQGVDGDVYGAQDVAVAPDGRGIAWWNRFDERPYRIEAALRRADGTYGAPVTLCESEQPLRSPAVAVSAGGRVVACWARWYGDDSPRLVEATQFLLPA